MEERKLESMTLLQLCCLCKENGIFGYSKYSKANLINYIVKKTKKEGNNFFCDVCGQYFKESVKISHKQSAEHKNSEMAEDGIQEVEAVYESRLKTYSLKNIKSISDLEECLESLRVTFIKKINKILKVMKLKVNFKLICTNQKKGEYSFKTTCAIILKSTNLEVFYDAVVNELLTKVNHFTQSRSDWKHIKIMTLELRTNKCYKDSSDPVKENRRIINSRQSIENVIQKPIKFTNFRRAYRLPFVVYANISFVSEEFCYFVKYAHEGYITEPVAYKGPNAVTKFVEMLKNEIKSIELFTKENEDKYRGIEFMTEFDEEYHTKTNICSICEKVIRDGKVRDHCHLTGKYRGPAHKNCNLLYTVPKLVTVFIENLSEKDAHVLIKELGINKVNDITLDSEDRIVSFSVKFGILKVNFVDSFRFVNHGIRHLSKKLDMHYIEPVTYNLEPKHNILIFANVIEYFRDVSLSTYNLDPAWYHTAGELAWDAILKITEVELELLTSYDMISMIDEGIKSTCNLFINYYAKMNNERIKDTDKNKALKYTESKNTNNLNWLMTQYLPYGGFKWRNNRDIEDIISESDTSDTGYLLEVEFEYPEELHNYHTNLLLASKEKIPASYNKLNLCDGKKYVVHYRNLKQYLEMGLKVKEVHRILEFKQRAWLKAFLDKNAKSKSEATNDFEKYFFKLMNYFAIRETKFNVREEIDIKLLDDAIKVEKLITKPEFRDRTIFDENVVALHMDKIGVKHKTLVYLEHAGMSISYLKY